MVLAVLVLKGVTGLLASGVVTYGVLQDLRGRRFSVLESLGIVVGRLLPLIGIVTCVMIGVFLGAILLLVPGVMLVCRWYVSAPACIVERRGVRDSMARSRDLTRGCRWQVFGAAVMIVGGSATILSGIDTLGALLAALLGWVAASVASVAGEVAAIAFNGVVVGVLYYDLRIAKEGIDIDKIASVFD